MPDWYDDRYGIRGATKTLELLDTVNSLVLDSGERTKWVFRGAGQVSWALSSSLHRRLEQHLGRHPTEQEMRESERHLVLRARQWGINLTESGVVADMHILAGLQHHGAPTRLIDVTSNPMTALWFACASPSDLNEDGVLFLFNVTGLPTYRSVDWQQKPTYGSVADPGGWTWEDALTKSAESKSPFIVVPTPRDHRMTAQEGLFITSRVPDENDRSNLFLGLYPPREQDQILVRFLWNFDGMGVLGPDSKPQNYTPGFAAIAVMIPANLKTKICTMLDVTYNRRWETVFPDIAGFSAAVASSVVPLFP